MTRHRRRVRPHKAGVHGLEAGLDMARAKWTRQKVKVLRRWLRGLARSREKRRNACEAWALRLSPSDPPCTNILLLYPILLYESRFYFEMHWMFSNIIFMCYLQVMTG